MGGQGGYVMAGKENTSAIGSHEAGNLIDQRRFAGAVRPDHRVQLARHDVKIDIAGDDEAAEILA